MRRLYRILLRLYPRDYKLLFEAEMLAAFEIAAQENVGRTGFLFTEILGLLQGAAAEWIAKRRTNPWVRARFLPDPMKMRPPGA